MLAYKLVRRRKDGSFGSLFINRKQKLKSGIWYQAESHATKGYAFRPGWHCLAKPKAPHLSTKDRCWICVEIKDFVEFQRPKSQGGVWYLAQQMRIL